ncbi:hypothetical protein N7462_000476 [Penicillium macrosclerotiorum]|uniref:uncharacterized protein n=1 Tax=Penicillium macrosclerotiorum TaxID=303699 RepID=UPI002549A372|nr:uncharacterized protein N7462_000476 [Penicillium macrosclerotiorum]KAJ5698471.1 hypothetical protein N7462_000476 [Penicillium macrosclerotiorum]
MQADGGQRSEVEKGLPNGWLPRSLRRSYLIFLAGLFLFMLVIIEVLRQYSRRQGGIVHWKWEEDLPTVIWGAYTYLPLVAALLAINLLDICAQDVQRLEPFFQLSKPEGTPASVLFLNYCCNGVSASVTALRSRHWIVLGTAFISLLFRLFLPTLLAGLVVLDEGNFYEQILVKTWPSLIDLDSQKAWLSAGASRLGPLGSSDFDSFFLPAPLNYAIPPTSIPFDEQNDSSLLTLNETIYWSNMTCVTSTLEGSSSQISTKLNSITSNVNETWSWSIRNVTVGNRENLNRSQCQVSIELDTRILSRKENVQARYWEPVNAASNLDVASAFWSNCTSFDLFGVMIDMKIAAENVSDPSVTVLACTGSYRQAQADVTFNSNASIADVSTDSSTIRSLDPTEFYVDGIHDLIASRYLSAQIPPIIEDTSPFNSSNSTTQSSNGVIIATARDLLSSQDYQEQIRRFWNNKFIVTVDRMFSPAAGPTLVEAKQQTIVVILVVAPKAAVIAETILLLGLVLVGFLASIYQRRPNFLRWDPGSIAAQCAIIACLFTASSRAMLSDPAFQRATTRQLRQWASDKRCQWSNESGEKQIQIVSHSEVSLSSSLTPRKRPDPMPHFLTLPWFLVECFLMMGTLAVFGVSLAYLRWKNINSFLSTGATVAMIFLNYGPTAIASIIGSFITSIYRHLSAMEPWIRLQDGMASTQQSVIENYGIQTPFLPLVDRRHRRPAILVVLSLVCLGDLGLRALSGGLFTPQLRTYSSPTSVLYNKYNSSALSADANRTAIDVSLLITSRVLNNVTYISWASTDGDFFFVPFAINDPSDDEYALYDTTTRGIGADIDCQVISSYSSSTDSSSGSTIWNYALTGDEKMPTCTVEIPTNTSNHVSRSKWSVQLFSPNGTDSRCQNTTIFVLASWNSTSTADANATDSLALHCHSKAHIQDFKIDFDFSGTIQNQEAVPGSSITSGQLFTNGTDILDNFNDMLTTSPTNLPSHNLSSQNSSSHRHLHHHHHHDWPGRLIAHAYNTSYPNTTDMNSKDLIKTVRYVYQNLFSTHLALWKDEYLFRLPSKSATQARGVTTETLWGLMPSNSLVVIIICLVCIDTVALTSVFILRYRRYRGPRVPRCIGSIIPWVVDSRMLDDCGDTYDMSQSEREKHLLEKDCRYRLGNFSTGNEQQLALDYDTRHSSEQIELNELPRTN